MTVSGIFATDKEATMHKVILIQKGALTQEILWGKDRWSQNSNRKTLLAIKWKNRWSQNSKYQIVTVSGVFATDKKATMHKVISFQKGALTYYIRQPRSHWPQKRSLLLFWTPQAKKKKKEAETSQANDGLTKLEVKIFCFPIS